MLRSPHVASSSVCVLSGVQLCVGVVDVRLLLDTCHLASYTPFTLHRKNCYDHSGTVLKGSVNATIPFAV